VLERWKNQRFEDHLCPCPQGADMDPYQPLDPADTPRELNYNLISFSVN
jgi:hypothetical protein